MEMICWKSYPLGHWEDEGKARPIVGLQEVNWFICLGHEQGLAQ